MTWIDPRIAELRGIAANQTVLAYLEQRSVPVTPQMLLAEGGFEVHTHPDLTERLAEAAQGTDARLLYAYGVSVLVHPNGVIFATAQGMSRVWLRLSPALQACEPGECITADMGKDWMGVKAWLSDFDPSADRQRLERWVRAAYQAATKRDSAS